MRHRVMLFVAGVAVPVTLGVATAGGAPASMRSSPAACSTAPRGVAHCLASFVGGASSTPTGLSPGQIISAYNWPTNPTAGAGETIAIVDAHDNPSVEQDLALFDGQFALPPCTTANGCFSKVDATGGADDPGDDPSWAFEIDIDVEWAHAIAPGAKILL